MKKVLILILLFFSIPSMPAQSLSEYQWENRLVIIFTEAEDSKEFQQQLKELESHINGLKDRKLIIIHSLPQKHRTVFLKADITKDWDWSTDNFDLVTCNLILEHIKNLNFIFSSAYNQLEAGGYFFISELHPFKQYLGSKARFDSEEGKVELETFTHHISEFLEAADYTGFQLKKLNEWFDEDGNQTPRILSLLFQKT